MKKHVEKFHNETEKLIQIKPNDITNLQSQNSIHEELKRFVCTTCRKFGLAKFICVICDKEYQNPSQLKIHIKIVHERIKKFVCPTCGQIFSQSQQLKRHILHIHEKRKDNICKTCDIYFKRCNLIIHRYRRDYICATCGKAFSSKKILKVHSNNIHREITDSIHPISYKCELCDLELSSKSLVLFHQMYDHKVNEKDRFQLYFEKNYVY